MTAHPLPDFPTLRVRTVFSDNSGTSLAGSRFFLKYAGAAPSGANCIALATGIEAAWVAHLATYPTDNWSLVEVDVLDIASNTGLSGQWNGSEACSGGTEEIPSNCALNVEFNIARRYRGGKPRMFLPPGDRTNLADTGHWTASFVDALSTDVGAFFTAVQALDVGAVGALTHTNLSYYSGFTNHTNTSGRERAVPTYRATALSDTVVGYAAKTEVGSQRRRRTATTA